MPDTCLPIPGGAIAQLGERLLCKQEVVGSIPSGSTSRGSARSQRTCSARVAESIGLAWRARYSDI